MLQGPSAPHPRRRWRITPSRCCNEDAVMPGLDPASRRPKRLSLLDCRVRPGNDSMKRLATVAPTGSCNSPFAPYRNPRPGPIWAGLFASNTGPITTRWWLRDEGLRPRARPIVRAGQSAEAPTCRSCMPLYEIALRRWRAGRRRMRRAFSASICPPALSLRLLSGDLAGRRTGDGPQL